MKENRIGGLESSESFIWKKTSISTFTHKFVGKNLNALVATQPAHKSIGGFKKKNFFIFSIYSFIIKQFKSFFENNHIELRIPFLTASSFPTCRGKRFHFWAIRSKEIQ